MKELVDAMLDLIAEEAALSKRERAVFALLVRGVSNEAIAEALGVGVRAAVHYVAGVMLKLGVRARGRIPALVLERLAEAEPSSSPQASAQLVVELLAMVGCQVSPTQAAAWTLEQREEAVDWAGGQVLANEDPRCSPPARPAFIPEPQRGGAG